MEINEEAVLVKYHGRDEIVTVPDGVKKIGTMAFANNAFIKEVILPQSLIEIGIRAFEGSSLERIVIPAGVKKIGYSAFQYCRQLRSVTLPDQLECIELYTFDGCRKLTKLELPPSLRHVGSRAFRDCGIAELRIPDGMTYISRDSFQHMKCLEKLDLPSTLRGIGEGAFEFCKSLKEVCIPESVLKIEWHAFYECYALEKAVFPKSFLIISKGAFSRTKIADSEELEEIYGRIASMKTYQKPAGYQEMSFDGMKFFYRAEDVNKETAAAQHKIGDFVYAYDITDSQQVYKDKNGKKVLRFYVSVPTFDSNDREWDSYRKLFLIPDEDGITGIMVCGGYRIAKVFTYRDIRWADEKTEKLLKSTNIF